MKPKIKTIEAFRGDFTYINMGSEKLEEKNQQGKIGREVIDVGLKMF